MLYVVFPPRFNIFPFRFYLRNQVISSCVKYYVIKYQILDTRSVKQKGACAAHSRGGENFSFCIVLF